MQSCAKCERGLTVYRLQQQQAQQHQQQPSHSLAIHHTIQVAETNSDDDGISLRSLDADAAADVAAADTDGSAAAAEAAAVLTPRDSCSSGCQEGLDQRLMVHCVWTV